MHMSVDGGCRHNGYNNAFAAAAVIVYLKWGRNKIYTTRLPRYPTPTNQAAELTAIVLALETALDTYNGSKMQPYMRVTITTDSKYAHGCMTEWRYKWVENGWINSAGNGVANQDIIQKALDLEEEVERRGNVQYIWVPRGDNQDADRAVNDELDDMNGYGDSDSSSSDGY